MEMKVKERLIQYLLSRKEEEGFTLVELIVVVMIIGILSSIAIPSFMNAGEKAKQQEAAVLVSSYIKAAQAYYIQNSTPVSRVGHLAEYVSVVGCKYGPDVPNYCKNNSPLNIGETESNSLQWNSPSGLFTMNMSESNVDRFIIRAAPQLNYKDTGFGVVGCYLYREGYSKVIPAKEKGEDIVYRLEC